MYESNFVKYGIFLLGLLIVLYLFHFIHVKIEWNGFDYEGFEDYDSSYDSIPVFGEEIYHKNVPGVSNVEVIDQDKWKNVKYVPKKKTKKEKELAKYRMEMLKKKKESLKKTIPKKTDTKTIQSYTKSSIKPSTKPSRKPINKTKKIKETYDGYTIHNPRENIDYETASSTLLSPTMSGETDETNEENRISQANFPTDGELHDYEDRLDYDKPKNKKNTIKENYCQEEDDDEDDNDDDDDDDEEKRKKIIKKKVVKKKTKLAPLAMSMNLQPNCRPRSYQLGRYGWSYMPPTTWSVPQMRPPTCLPSGKSCRVCPTASTEWSSKYGDFLTREDWDTNQENIEMVSDKNYWYPGYISADPVA
jgi:hypothetical protein